MEQLQSSLINKDRVISIINSRVTVLPTHVGEQLVFTVQGDGTLDTAVAAAKRDSDNGLPARKRYFDSYIHNAKANSAEAMSRPEVKQLLKDAIAEEMKGPASAEAASLLYNKYLNTIQMSFNVIAQVGRRKFANGDRFKAVIGAEKTKAGHTAFTLNEIAYVAPVAAAKVAFDITSLVD